MNQKDAGLPGDNKANQREGADKDALLMIDFQQGNTDAFNALVGKYQQMIIGVISRYIGDRTSAEDLAQEVFLRVYRNKENYQPKVPFKYYIFTIAHNLCINEIRDSKTRRTKTTSFEDGVALEAAVERGQDDEIQQAVREAIESLPPQQRMAVILDQYHEMSYADVGKIMNLSLTATKSIIWRARQNLKEQLKKYIL